MSRRPDATTLAVKVAVAENIVRIRCRAGLPQHEVGLLAGLHPTEIGLIERQERLVRLDTLIRVAGALDVEPSELLKGAQWTPCIRR